MMSMAQIANALIFSSLHQHKTLVIFGQLEFYVDDAMKR
jgi:hypothetical protein